MIPVTGGRMNPPKNRSPHKHVTKRTRWSGSKKGIGRAHKTADTPATHYKICALQSLYPPKDVVIMPPIITPEIGAVKHRAAKYHAANSGSISITFCI